MVPISVGVAVVDGFFANGGAVVARLDAGFMGFFLKSAQLDGFMLGMANLLPDWHPDRPKLVRAIIAHRATIGSRARNPREPAKMRARRTHLAT